MTIIEKSPYFANQRCTTIRNQETPLRIDADWTLVLGSDRQRGERGNACHRNYPTSGGFIDREMIIIIRKRNKTKIT